MFFILIAIERGYKDMGGQDALYAKLKLIIMFIIKI